MVCNEMHKGWLFGKPHCGSCRELEMGPSAHSRISSNGIKPINEGTLKASLWKHEQLWKGSLSKIRALELTEQEFRIELRKIGQNYCAHQIELRCIHNQFWDLLLLLMHRTSILRLTFKSCFGKSVWNSPPAAGRLRCFSSSSSAPFGKLFWG